MANPWDTYADYDSRATVAERLSAVRSYKTALRQAMGPSVTADGLSINHQTLLEMLRLAEMDEQRYQKASRRTTVVPIRAVSHAARGRG